MKINNKSILVIDTPDTCLDCMFYFGLDDGINACCSVMSDKNDKSLYRDIECDGGCCQNKPEWCPLKELPERRKYNEEYFNGNVRGWNDCLRTILGENNNV